MKLDTMNENVNKWNVVRKELVTLSDGQYWLPAYSSDIYADVTDLYIDDFWDDPKNIFGTGNKTLHFYFECYPIHEEEDVWVAVYRVGSPEPLWISSVSLDVSLSYILVEGKMKLDVGEHFILINNVGLDDRMKDIATLLDYGIRYDFMVYPDGSGLIHPEIQKIQFSPRSLSDWKEMVRKHCLEGITAEAKLVFQKPFDLTGNYLQIEIFDESMNWIAWSDYVSEEGFVSMLGFFPILDGEYRFVLLHNQIPILYGDFVCSNGICTVERMTKWDNDDILYNALASHSHANDLKFNQTTYGRRLQLLEDISFWRDDESCLEGDYLEKLLAE